MEILEDVLNRASAGDDDAEGLLSLLVTHGKPKEIVIALDEALGNLVNRNTADNSDDEDTDATKLGLDFLSKVYTYKHIVQ